MAWRQIQNHAGTVNTDAFEFFEIRHSFWSILSPFPSSSEKKGEERKIKANPASVPRIAGIFVSFERNDQQPTKVTGGSSLFFLLPFFLSSRAENSFWQANCRKISYQNSVSFLILQKLKKSKVTEQYQLSFLCFDRGSVMKVKSLRSIKE